MSEPLRCLVCGTPLLYCSLLLVLRICPDCGHQEYAPPLAQHLKSRILGALEGLR